MNPAVTDYFLNVPAGLNIDVVKAAMDEKYPNLNVEWAPFPMPGTHAVAGRAVLYLRMRKHFTKAQLEALFTAKGVNWTVIGIRSAYPINPVTITVNGVDTIEMRYVVTYFAGKAQILPAINDVPTGQLDANNRPVMRAPTLTDVINLCHYFGTDTVTL
jgi:hypothetical protein